jgi:hypothetical protein
MVFFLSAPTEIRTPVVALKGPRPGPLDDGGVHPWIASRIFERADCIIHANVSQAILWLNLRFYSLVKERQQVHFVAIDHHAGAFHMQVGK